MILAFGLISVSGCGGNGINSHPLSVTFLDIGDSEVDTQVSYKGELVSTVPAVPFATPFPSPRRFPKDVREGELLSRRPPRFPGSNVSTVGNGPNYWGVLSRDGMRLLTYDIPVAGNFAKIRHLVGDTALPQVRVILREYKTGTVIVSAIVSVFVQSSTVDNSLQTTVPAGTEYITEVRDETTNALLDRFGRFTPRAGKNYLVITSRRPSSDPVPVGRAIGKVLEQPD